MVGRGAAGILSAETGDSATSPRCLPPASFSVTSTSGRDARSMSQPSALREPHSSMHGPWRRPGTMAHPRTETRIDQAWVTRDLARHVRFAWVDAQPVGSDHQPVWLEMDV